MLFPDLRKHSVRRVARPHAKPHPVDAESGVISQGQFLQLFVEVTSTLVDDLDLPGFLHTLTTSAAQVTGAGAVGLVLTDHQERVRHLASSNEEDTMLELLQMQDEDGPCLDAIEIGRPVVNADLSQAGDRWPIFTPAARAAGFHSVHAFPMRLRDQTIGALIIFGVDTGRFDPGDVLLVQALADVATIAILQEHSRQPAEVVTEQLQAVVDSRIVIEQAMGAIAGWESVTVTEAFDVMQSTARSTGQKLPDIARAVLADLQSPRP